MAPFNGYWGKPTSTLDWCEINYEVTYFIAEFCKFSSIFLPFLAFECRSRYSSGWAAVPLGGLTMDAAALVSVFFSRIIDILLKTYTSISTLSVD